MAMARQTWDEVRHAQLGMGLLESYGGAGRRIPRHARRQPTERSHPGRRRTAPRAPAAPSAARLMRDPLDQPLGDQRRARRRRPRPLQGHLCPRPTASATTLMEHVYDYNWADEVTHTTIGDYFVKALCDGNPAEEQRALRAHAMFEGMRERLSGSNRPRSGVLRRRGRTGHGRSRATLRARFVLGGGCPHRARPLHQLWPLPPRLPDGDHPLLHHRPAHARRRARGLHRLRLCVPVCPEDCIVPDPATSMTAAELEAAKGRARDWARRRNASARRS